jgi:pimeloyl-ACP methyl ester carboxylesterase
MEGNLLHSIWRKLIEALRFRGTPQERAKIDESGHRDVESFSVITDGLTIRGRIFFPAEQPAMLYPAIIICHGIPGSGTARPPSDPGYEKLAEDFASLGMAAVIFNFRGCGDSGGNFDMAGWVRDLEAVVDKILNTPHIDPTRVMLLGFSGGGAAAIRVAADNPAIYSLAVVGTPSNFGIFQRNPLEIVDDFRHRGIIRDEGFPPDLDRWIKGFENIEPRRWVAQFRGKRLLVAHGDADEVAPVEHGREIHSHAPAGVSTLAIIPDGAHRLRLDARCVALLKDWFLQSLGWKS